MNATQARGEGDLHGAQDRLAQDGRCSYNQTFPQGASGCYEGAEGEGAPDSQKGAFIRWLTAFLIGFTVAMLLVGCASPGFTPIEGTGEWRMPPPGWQDFCTRYPTDPACEAAEKERTTPRLKGTQGEICNGLGVCTPLRSEPVAELSPEERQKWGQHLDGWLRLRDDMAVQQPAWAPPKVDCGPVPMVCVHFREESWCNCLFQPTRKP